MAGEIYEGFSVSHAQVLAYGQSFIDAIMSAATEREDVYGVNESSLDPDTDDYDNEGDDAVLSTWSWFNFADVAVQAGYLSMPLISELTSRPVDTIAPGVAANEVQTLTGGTATGGTFALTFAGQTTAPIAFGATAAVIASALQALPNVGAGGFVGTGGPVNTTPVVLTAGAALANRNVSPITVDGALLTGGTTHSMAQTTAGSSAHAGGTAIDLFHENSFNVAPKPMIVVMPSKNYLGTPRRLVMGLYRVNFKPITFDGPAYKDGFKVNYNGRAVMSSVDEMGVPFPDGKKRCGRILSVAAV